MKRLTVVLVACVAASACGGSGSARPAGLQIFEDPASFVAVTTPRGDTVWKSDKLLQFYSDDCSKLEPWASNLDYAALGADSRIGWNRVCIEVKPS